MSGIQLKITLQANKQENVIRNEEKNQPFKTNSEPTKMLKIAGKQLL